MSRKQNNIEQNRIAEAVRQACVEAALTAYEDAGMGGLCYEGRWECAVDAMRALNVAAIVEWLESK
ncbi:MAG: hypothetical protein KDE46_00130 [Caldilineaceae bacterium]|nr:hypothetical protein [Caldilineaceae bacterium]